MELRNSESAINLDVKSKADILHGTGKLDSAESMFLKCYKGSEENVQSTCFFRDAENTKVQKERKRLEQFHNMDDATLNKYWTMKGILNFHKGNFEVAEQDFKHVKSVGESALINMYLSKTLASMGKKREALEVAQGTSFDGSLDDDFIQIEMSMENDKVEQALELLRKLTVADDSDEMAKVATLTGQCHFKLRNIEDSLKEHDKAIEYWEDIFEREEETDMIQAYFHAGLAFKYAHQDKKALELLEKANVNAMKMYKGIDLNKHPWFVQLTEAIKETRISAKSDVKVVQMDKPKKSKKPKKPSHHAQVASDVAGVVVKSAGKAVGGVHSLMKGLFKF